MDLPTLFKMVATNGVWAVLFLFLLLYELKDSRTREEKYQKAINDLIDRLEIVNDIKKEVTDLNERFYPVYDCTIKQTLDKRFKESWKWKT